MRKNRTIWMAILLIIAGLAVGYFVGEFFVYLSRTFDFLSWLSFIGYSHRFGFDSISLNLVFANISFGLIFHLSVMGLIFAILFVFFYFRRR